MPLIDSQDPHPPPPSAALERALAGLRPVRTRVPGRTLAGVALRRLLPLGGWRVALALGGAAGALAGLVLHLHCPTTDPAHVTLIHGAALVVPGLGLAAALGLGSLFSRANPDKR